MGCFQISHAAAQPGRPVDQLGFHLHGLPLLFLDPPGAALFLEPAAWLEPAPRWQPGRLDHPYPTPHTPQLWPVFHPLSRAGYPPASEASISPAHEPGGSSGGHGDRERRTLWPFGSRETARFGKPGLAPDDRRCPRSPLPPGDRPEPLFPVLGLL